MNWRLFLHLLSSTCTRAIIGESIMRKSEGVWERWSEMTTDDTVNPEVECLDSSENMPSHVLVARNTTVYKRSWPLRKTSSSLKVCRCCLYIANNIQHGKHHFLTNENNKQQLINLLTKYLLVEGHDDHQCKGAYILGSRWLRETRLGRTFEMWKWLQNLRNKFNQNACLLLQIPLGGTACVFFK